jgi:hypothetical protein
LFDRVILGTYCRRWCAIYHNQQRGCDETQQKPRNAMNHGGEGGI